MQFLCPNGHKIHCGEERAGKAAKCPKCGVKFRIPTLDELSVEEPDGSAAEPSAPPPAASEAQSVPAEIGAGGAAGQDQIEFLCPNDHLLHGPSWLQGRPGECPECGSKFRIPSYDELEEDEEDEEPPEPEPTPPPPIPPRDRERIADDLLEPLKPEEEALSIARKEHDSAVALDNSDVTQPAAGLSMAALFGTLWAHKADGATVEVYHGNGQRLTPDRFFPALSRGGHALFANQEPGGSFTLTALAWDSVSSVVVRGVKRVPEGA